MPMGGAKEGNMSRTSFVTILITLTLATVARAQDGRWTLEGRHASRGPFTGSLEVRGSEVTERLVFGGAAEELRRGEGNRIGDRLELEVAPLTGLAAAVEGGSASGGRRLSITFGAADTIEVTGRDEHGDSAARGTIDRAPAPSRVEGKGKHLIALARRALESRAYRGVRLNEEFNLGSYLHVGVGGALRPLRPEALTPTQRASTGPRDVWLVSEVSGAARVPLSASIPLGSVTLGVGVEPGARVRWEVTDRYAMPEGIRDVDTMVQDLKDVAARTFDLPLDATEALALVPGARRILEAEAAIAIAGNLSIGHEVADIDGIVRIGASARAGGYWRLSGDVRFELERLAARGVRLRVTRATRTVREASAEALIGAMIEEATASTRLERKLEYIDRAPLRAAAAAAIAHEANGLATDVVRFHVSGSMGSGHDDEVDLCFRFDLGRDAARAAYERAVRGDLTAADAAALEAGSGVQREFRVLEVETRTWAGADLRLSVILKAGARRTVTFQDLSVEGEIGVARYEVFRFTRERSLTLFGRDSNRRRRALEIDVLRRATPDGQVTRGLRWTLDVEDPSTTMNDAALVRRVLAGWGLDPRSNLPDPESRGPFRSMYGRTRTNITVEVGEAGIAAALAASDAALLDAYAQGWTLVNGEAPTWATASGRERLSWVSSSDDESARREKAELDRAQEFVQGVKALAASQDMRERAKRLESLAKGARYDLYAVSAFLSLAPREQVRIVGSLAGERIDIGVSHVGAAYAPLVVADPRTR